MNRIHRFSLVILLSSLALLLILWATQPKLLQAVAPQLSARNQVEQAWQRANQVGVFEFRSEVEQTINPAPRLNNVGRPPRQQNLYLEGVVDQPNDKMQLNLWLPHQNPTKFDEALQIEVENGQTRGRAPGSKDWEKMDAIHDAFAPTGDPLGFLAGAKNVENLGTETRQLPSRGAEEQGRKGEKANRPNPSSQITFTRYQFDFDGPAFGAHMNEHLQRELRAKGELPPSVNLQTPEMYKKMTGQGEIWIDEAGLPIRLLADLNLPAQSTATGQTKATIKTDLFNYDHKRLAQASTSFTAAPLAWLAYHSPLPKTANDWHTTGMHLASWMLVAGLFALAISTMHTRRFYQITATAVIVSMVAMPLVQALQLEAFAASQHRSQESGVRSQETRQAEAQAEEDLQQKLNQPKIDPHTGFRIQDSGFRIQETDIQSSLTPDSRLLTPNLAVSSVITDELDNTDSDGDGLSDTDEADWGTCAVSTDCPGTDPTDSDGDGLTDGAEVNQLYTNPNAPDSDGDTITDTLEVTGFSYNGKTWYLDPMESDTNKDGLADMTECPELSLFADVLGSTCPDTNGDGTPDVWDDDNDGDGVHDKVDLSPFSVLGKDTAFSDSNPFLLQVDQVETDLPLFVDLQFRTVDPDHLTHQYHILDWPAQDTAGHIQRKLDTTFYNTTSSAQSNADNAHYGDMRLIPLLEIDIPYQDGHYANLPVLDTAPITLTATSPLTDWLDTAVLDPYGISVSKKDESSGDLILYAPINLIKNENGAGNAAFSARIPYQASQSTWGNSHQYRLIWLVQMITDACIDADNDGSITDEDVETCERVEDVQVIQVYDDEFYVTGLEIIEDHGYEVALIAQSPEPDLVYEEALWETMNNLSLTFIEGTDCAATTGSCVDTLVGERDVTVATINSYVSQWITETTMIVDQHSYPHQGYMAYVMMTDTLSLLNTHFNSYPDLNPTIIFAQERKDRTLVD